VKDIQELAGICEGRPAAVLGGGPSLPDQLRLVPADAVLIGVNHHASRLVDCDYIVFNDPHTFDDVRDLPGEKISPHPHVSNVRPTGIWPAGFSAGTGAWLAGHLGCRPIILCGMDLYQGDRKYFHGEGPPEPVDLGDRLAMWRRCFDQVPGCDGIRAAGGPLVEVFGEWTPSAEAPAEAQVIRSLEETARFFDRSLPTVRTWVKEGCPVVEAGKHGVAYKLDLKAVKGWLDARDQAETMAAEARAEQDVQLRLEWFGPDTMQEDGAALTPKQRADVVRAEYDWIRIAKERGELVRADGVQGRLVDVFAVLRDRLRAMPDLIGAEEGLADDVVARMAERVDEMLDDVASEIADLMTERGGHAEAA